MGANEDYSKIMMMNNELNSQLTNPYPAPKLDGDIQIQQNMEKMQKELSTKLGGGDNGGMSQARLQSAMAGAINAFKTPYCDEKCENDKKKWNLLYQLYILDETKKQTPKLINDLEEQYYEITKDDDWYKEWKEKRVSKEVNEGNDKLKDYHEGSYANLMTDLHNYNAQYTYLDNLGVLTNTYRELNDEMDKKNKDLVNVKNTSFRKAEYEQGYSENYIRVNNFLYKFYWGLVIFYIIYFILINKRYQDIRLWTIAIILMLFPYFIAFLHSAIGYILKQVIPYFGF